MWLLGREVEQVKEVKLGRFTAEVVVGRQDYESLGDW